MEGNNDREATTRFRFDPPLYIQRYDMVVELMKRLDCRSLMDIGCAECKLVNLVKNWSDELTMLVGVDLCGDTLRSATDLFSRSIFDVVHARPKPLELYLIRGDISQPDDYFVRQFGPHNCQFDMISLVEVVEHMYPDTLRECIRTVFERLAPRCVVITTPNREFNVVFEEENSGTENTNKFRHWDHKFEWTRDEFETWCREEILQKYTDYCLLDDSFTGLGLPPAEYPLVGMCTQAAVFIKKSNTTRQQNGYKQYLREKQKANIMAYMNKTSSRRGLESPKASFYLNETEFSAESGYSVVYKQAYPFEPYENFESESERDEFIMNEMNYLIRFLASRCQSSYKSTSWEEEELIRDIKAKNDIDEYDEKIRLVSISQLLEFSSMRKLKVDRAELLTKLAVCEPRLTHDQEYIIYEAEDLDHSFSTSSQISNYSEKMSVCSMDSPVSETSSVWSSSSNLSSSTTPARLREEKRKSNNESTASKTTMTTMKVVMKRDEKEENWDEEVDMSVMPIVVPKFIQTRAEYGQFEDAPEDGNECEEVNKETPCRFIYDLLLESDMASSTSSVHDIEILSHFPGVNYQSDAAIKFSKSIRPRLRKKRCELKTQSTPPHPDQFLD